MNHSLSNPYKNNYNLLFGFCALIVFSVCSALFLESLVPLVLPPAVLVVFIAFANTKHFYFLFFFTLPFSVEVYLPGGLGTDLPSEPLMLIMALGAIVLFFKDINKIKAGYLYHPISLCMWAHIFWVFIAAIFAIDQIVAIKFFVAKLWYVIPFYFFSLYVLKNPEDLLYFIRACLLGVFIATVYVFIRHASLGFSFDMINRAGSPIFRNHVTYAAILTICMPYLWVLIRNNSKGTFQRKSLVVIGLFFLVAIYLTYTRAAYVTLLLAVITYYIIQRKLIKPAIYFSLIVTLFGTIYLVQNNRYFAFAPEYEKTITHDKFDNLIAATYKMEDLSTMERVYRWVAGYQMVQERPLLGFGPNNFYPQYQAYSLSKFKTYVSDNPDKSGIHNYYLMTFVEQGVLGFLIFLILAIIPLIIGERIYHKISSPLQKNIVMAAILSLIIIDAYLLINDLIETDKVGPFFFINLAIIVIYDLKYRYMSKAL